MRKQLALGVALAALVLPAPASAQQSDTGTSTISPSPGPTPSRTWEPGYESCTLPDDIVLSPGTTVRRGDTVEMVTRWAGPSTGGSVQAIDERGASGPDDTGRWTPHPDNPPRSVGPIAEGETLVWRWTTTADASFVAQVYSGGQCPSGLHWDTFTDRQEVTVVDASPSPSPSCLPGSAPECEPTATPSAPPITRCGPFRGEIAPRHVVAGEAVTVTIRATGPYSNFGVAFFEGYSRTPALSPLPDGPYEGKWSGVLAEGEEWIHTVTFRPSGNTRINARIHGSCGWSAERTGLSFQAFSPYPREEQVVTVAPRLDRPHAVRHGRRDYTFSGASSLYGGALVNLYRVTAEGRDVLTSQTRTAADGSWSVRRRFVGSGHERFGFRVRTGGGMANAPGVSEARPTLVF